MDFLRNAAAASVGRACGFVGLAIGCVMIGLSFDPPAMVRSGAILTLILTLVLCLKASLAARQDYRATETWLMLDKEQRPPPEIAQRAFSTVLRETYIRFASFAAGISASLWLAAVGLRYLA